MGIKSIIGATCIYILSIAAAPAFGSVIYSYTGNNFDAFSSPSSYTTSNAVTGNIELAGALSSSLIDRPVVPLSFSFYDGVRTITEINATRSNFYISTDAAGLISGWTVQVIIDILGGSEVEGGETQIIGSTNLEQAGIFFDIGKSDMCNGNVNVICTNSVIDYGRVDAAGAWAVQSGDVGAVPVPAAVWLFGSGLLGLVGVARRKKA